ncbi:MAG TPA: GNAT family N-acetyltransferase [Opitutaceae bacterium]|nr:GNAT family N-acetyltransferase [Opitutaceae bacterium]
MPHNIRSATVEDVPTLFQLIRELAAYEKLSRQVEATEEKLRATLFPSCGPAAAECLLASAEDGAAAGFAVYFPTYSTFLAKPGLYLEDLYVRPQFRRRGIGKALLVHIVGLARQRGCGRMEWSVLDWNEPAQAFYRSLGATVLPDWRICRLTEPPLPHDA